MTIVQSSCPPCQHEAIFVVHIASGRGLTLSTGIEETLTSKDQFEVISKLEWFHWFVGICDKVMLVRALSSETDHFAEFRDLQCKS